MKRAHISVKVEAALLRRARRQLGAKTYTAAVHGALREFLRLRQVQRLSEFYGSQAWNGNLSETREDKPPSRPSNKR
jgi:Arc/MetJ family transcription regulator